MGENWVSGGPKRRQTNRKSVGANWVKSYILMGLSTVSWLGKLLDGSYRCLRRVFNRSVCSDFNDLALPAIWLNCGKN